jgi:hypothetical protein
MIFEDTPAAIPVPDAFRHRRTEVIVWPLDDLDAREDAPIQDQPSARRPIGLAEDRGVPLPDDFFASLPEDLLAAFNGER